VGGDKVSGTWELVKLAMETHRDSASVQASGCLMVGILARDLDISLLLVEDGAVDIVFDAIFGHPQTAAVQTGACVALRHLALCGDNKGPLVEKGAIETILGSMIDCETSSQVQAEACWALSVIAAYPEYGDKVVDENGQDIIIGAMRAFPGNRDVIEGACRALVLLAYNNPHNQRVIAEAGAIPLLCDTLCNLCMDPLVVERAMRALFNIVGCSPERRLECIAEGVLSWAKAALERFDEVRYPQLHHCTTEMVERVDPKHTYRDKLESISEQLAEVKAQGDMCFQNVQATEREMEELDVRLEEMASAHDAARAAFNEQRVKATEVSQAAEREADNWKRLKEAAESEAVKLAQLLEEAKRKAVASHQAEVTARALHAKALAKEKKIVSEIELEEAALDVPERHMIDQLETAAEKLEKFKKDVAATMNQERALIRTSFKIV